MARKATGKIRAALALALLLPIPAGEAQNAKWRRPGVAAPPPIVQPRVPAQLPNYYFERGGQLAVPKGPVSPGDVINSLRARGFNIPGQIQQRGSTMIIPRATGPRGECVQLVIGPTGAILGVQPCPLGR